MRTIGPPERRFAEDKLRMLRAVRFAARFGYQIDPATMQSIRRLAPQIHQVSCERIRDELTKMLTEGQARRAFLLLDESGLLREAAAGDRAHERHPAAPAVSSRGRRLRAHPAAAGAACPPDARSTLAWGALLHDVGKPSTFRRAPDRIRFDGHVEIGVRIAAELLARLRFSNRDRDQILALVENHMRFADVRKMKDSTFKRFVRLPEFDEHLAMHRLDCLASHANLELYHYTRERLAAIPSGAERPAPLINGHDLIAAGYHPGPRFAEILAAVEDAQLEGAITTREEALGFAESNFPPAVGDMVLAAPALRYNRPMEQVSEHVAAHHGAGVEAPAAGATPPGRMGLCRRARRGGKNPRDSCTSRSKPCWSKFPTPTGARSSTPWRRSL